MRREEQARLILDQPIYADSYKVLRERYVLRMVNHAPDTPEHQAAWAALNVLDDVNNEFTGILRGERLKEIETERSKQVI